MKGINNISIIFNMCFITHILIYQVEPCVIKGEGRVCNVGKHHVNLLLKQRNDYPSSQDDYYSWLLH